MADDKIPQVIWMPEAKESVEKDPALAKAMTGITEVFKNAMQGVQDGRYKSFEDAVEAMSGIRPEKIEAPNPPKYGYYLSTNKNPKGDGLLAVISDGHPQRGHQDIEICDVEVVKNIKEAKAWYRQRCRDLPWREKK